MIDVNEATESGTFASCASSNIALATVAQPSRDPVDGQMDALHHALVRVSSTIAPQELELHMVQGIEIGKPVAYRACEQRVGLQQCLVPHDRKQRIDRIAPFGADAREDVLAQTRV